MSVIDVFDKYVLSGLPAGAAWDAIKWGWHKATDKSWEQLYVQAFADAVAQLKPVLARKYGGGDVTWDEKALEAALRRDVGIRPGALALGQTEQQAFVADLATALAERGFLRIDQQGLGAEDHAQLIQTVIETAHRRFKRLVESNEAAFKKAVLEKEGGLSDSDRQAVRTWLRQETGLLLGAIGEVKEDTAAIRKILDEQRPAPPRLSLQRPPRAEHFTGRQQELAQLLAELQPGRVVTLCGPGGIGKTALAAEAIWQLAPAEAPPARFPDGIIFHSFYNQPQVDLALEHIARTFGEEPKPTPQAAARRVLAGRRLLLLLDGAEEAKRLDQVLAVTGGCGVLVTSRNRQDAVAERQDIAPLPWGEAVALLQAWGQAYAADEAAARDICQLLGRLPLAVRLVGRYLDESGEFAAEYLEWLAETPLRALDHGQRREQSVPLLLERSLAQVSAEARQVVGVAGLLALAPFRREIVAAALDVEANDVRRPLGELVNYGLLLRDEAGYRLSHALIHTYAGRRVEVEADVLARLVAVYEALFNHFSQRGPAGYRVLDREQAHLLYLLGSCAGRKQWQRVLDLVRASDNYFDIQGHTVTRQLALGQALPAARQLGHRQNEGTVLGNLGLAYRDLGQVEQAIDYHQQALRIAREIGDRQGEAADLGNLGSAYYVLGQVEQAIDYHQQALRIDREIGYRQGEAAALGNLGLAYSALGQVEQAIDHYEQALRIAREIGDRQGEAAALGFLGNAYRDLGQVKQAIDHYQQALRIAREIGDRQGEANQLGNLGNVYSDLGQVEQAIDHYEQALRIHREIGYRQGEASDLGNLGNAYSDLGQVEQAIDYHQQALRIAREIGDRQGEANHLGNLGLAYSDLGQGEQAIDHYQQALLIDREIGYRQGEAADLGNLGLAYSALGQVEQAIDHYEQALLIDREIGYRQGEATQLGNLGNAYRALGQVEQAIDYHQQALLIDREIGYRQGEATQLGNLGLAYSVLGQVEQARHYLQQALTIFEEIKSPNADLVRQWLNELTQGAADAQS